MARSTVTLSPMLASARVWKRIVSWPPTGLMSTVTVRYPNSTSGAATSVYSPIVTGARRQSSLRRRRGEAAAPRDDVRDLAAVDGAREALVEVRVPGEHRVGPEAGGRRTRCRCRWRARSCRRGRRRPRRADGGTARMTAALAGLPCGLQPLELAGEERELLVGDRVGARPARRSRPGPSSTFV